MCATQVSSAVPGALGERTIMPTASHTGDSSVVRACVAKFRLAWALGERPRIDDFIPPADSLLADADRRRELLTALVVVDLEHRWQSAAQEFTSGTITKDYDPHASVIGAGEAYSLDDYLTKYPELRSAELPLELLEVAFRCLHARNPAASIDDFLRDYDLPPPRRAALIRRLSRMGTATTSSNAGQSRTLSFVQAGSVKEAMQPGFEKMKLSFGPYKVIGLVGSGGYGAVFLGHDERLDRLVAIKVAHAAGPSPDSEQDQAHRSFVDEARRIAQLNHPNIVKVLDVDRSDSYAWYLVMEYVDGPSFKEAVTSGRMTRDRIARVIAQVARAVHHAHLHNIFHRDLKPSNILLAAGDWPYVVDFGMAVHVRDQRSQAGRVMGTPAYMSPEQVRGEGHRLDGRTDVWSLGVTLYEALSGQRPFGGEDPDDLFDEILHKEARPLRQLNDDVPAELERICLRCLAKRMPDRYSSAADLAADLEHFLDASGQGATASATPPPADGKRPGLATPPPSKAARIVPRGLRAFGERDAEFFVDLLPGPYARDGLPESIHRWQTAIERPELPAQAVCVLYGPSGSGKSSIVRAGILPRLAPDIRCAIVDAGSGNVEGNLRAVLLRMYPEVPTGAGLPEACAWLRRRLSSGNAGKVLLVIDQFEHWLHANRANDDESLVAALRHCDGASLQCLITVRSDFWLGATRFMEQLEAPLVEEVNCGRVDLFPQRHARKVLQYFGEAYGCLPGGNEPLSAAQEEFLDKAAALVADDGWVAPVRLALLAEMLKSREWRPETLRTLGGERGLGVQFLEETFDSARGAPAHRLHRRAAESILAELLPEEGVDIKGACRSRDELLAASGLRDHQDQFRTVIDILDRQLRLITPVDRRAATREDDDQPPPAGLLPEQSPAYQLTHDYLVPAIREWLTRRKQQSRDGRAQLCLQRRARQWAPSREPRYLPSLAEMLKIALFTKHDAWTPEQRAMMRSATARQTTTAAAAVAVVIAIIAFLVRGSAEDPLAVFLDAGRPVEQRVEAVDRLVVEDSSQLRSVVRLLETERNDDVLNHGSEWLFQYVAGETARGRQLPVDDRSMIAVMATHRLDPFAQTGEGVSDAARTALFQTLTLVASPSDAIDVVVTQPDASSPKLNQAIIEYLGGLRLPTSGAATSAEDGEAARKLAESLIALMHARPQGAVRTAAARALAELSAEQLLTIFVAAFCNEPTDEAQHSVGIYLESLDREGAGKRSQEIVEAIGRRLAVTIAAANDDPLSSTAESEYLLLSLQASAPLLTSRPQTVIDQLVELLSRPERFRGGGVLDLACGALARLHRAPTAGVEDAAALRPLHQLLVDRDESDLLRAAAAESLGVVADAGAVQSLATVAAAPGESQSLRMTAVRALGTAGSQRESLDQDLGDVLTVFRTLLGSQEIKDSTLLVDVVSEYAKIAPAADFADIMPTALELGSVGEGIVPWRTFCSFLVHWPDNARPIIETYFEQVAHLPSELFPPRRNSVSEFLQVRGFYDVRAVENAGRSAIVALAEIAAEHADEAVRQLASGNLIAAAPRLQLPTIDVQAETSVRDQQLKRWRAVWNEVGPSTAIAVNGQLEVR